MSNISSSMYQGLSSLLSINSQMTEVQSRLSTGKKLNSAADGAVQWLTVSNFQSRVSGLQAVNDGLTTAITQMRTASTALSSIRKSINDTLSQLKDASTTQAAVSSTVENVITDAATTQFRMNITLSTGGQFNRATSLGNANLRVNGVALAQGSIYSISNGATTRFIEISQTTDTTTGGDGTSSTSAIKVKTVAELLNAVNGFVNVTGANLPANDNQVSNFNALFTYNATGGLTFAQARPGNTGTINPDIASVFAGNRSYTVGVNPGTDDHVTKSGSVGAEVMQLRGRNHTGTTGSTSVAADPKRAVAANAMTTLVDQINSMVRDARTNGVNLLNGEDLSVVINAENSSLQFQFTNTSGAATRFNAEGLGINLATLRLTGSDIRNFNNDTDLTAAINALQAARDTSDTGIARLGTWQSSLETRAGFNTEINKILTSAISGLSSSDATADAAELASLQTRQSFANSILAIIKQGEQNPIQLLR